jgi:malic enzyme
MGMPNPTNGDESGAASRHPVPVEVDAFGTALLRTPLLNKDAAFTAAERASLQLAGLLPPRVVTMRHQLRMETERMRRKTSDLEKYIGLMALQDRNETLYHRLVLENLEEVAPIIYTPTVGEACSDFSLVERRPRGLWITPDDRPHIADLLRHAGDPQVKLIVATDNERILGLGDQGAGGIGIPIGKLALYTAGAGLHPQLTLAVSLDVGTDNEGLLQDPLYTGIRRPRLRGRAYYRFIEAFVAAVTEVYPGAVLQWEDFKQHNAIRLLERYRHRLPSFNDDIQGTASVVLAGILAGLRQSRQLLTSQRVVMLGAGAAGLGIARLIRLALVDEGMAEEEAGRAVVLLDSRGLIYQGRAEIAEDKQPYSLDQVGLNRYGIRPDQGGVTLEQVVEAVKPSVLVGTSGTPGTFSESVIRSLAKGSRRPLVLPLSNPTSKSEAVPEDVMTWTDGRALVATGSPFGPVVYGGRRRIVAQANNVFIFPGVGLGIIVAGAAEVSDRMFLAAARRLAECVSAQRLGRGGLFPPISDLRTVSREVAVAVVKEARDSGLGRQLDDQAVAREIDRTMWFPEYAPYVLADRLAAGGRERPRLAAGA